MRFLHLFHGMWRCTSCMITRRGPLHVLEDTARRHTCPLP